MKSILVTGGAGFLGSHLCATLLNMGNEVICVDNYFYKTPILLQHSKSFFNYQIGRRSLFHKN